MKEEELELLIAKFRKIIGPVADTLAGEAAAEVGALSPAGKFAIRSEDNYKMLLIKMRERFSKVIGFAATSGIIGDEK